MKSGEILLGSVDLHNLVLVKDVSGTSFCLNIIISPLTYAAPDIAELLSNEFNSDYIYL